MYNINITIESLLETHHLPFVLIDKNLKVIAVNRAWENQFDISRKQQIGQPCCIESGNCRHQHLCDTLEPYSSLISSNKTHSDTIRVRGYPLLDSDGQIYIGESIFPVASIKANLDSGMIGSSLTFLALKNRLLQSAQTQMPILLTGETGTGKELASKFIHENSKNAGGKFVIMDCTLLGENLFESELFGYEKGAFTGAKAQKKGLFELADNGTLFLDEIGELPLAQQSKLLRALENGQFRRVGGTSQLTAKVRMICATHKNLANMVSEGTFREDLFYRLSVFPIELPPLRERKQDLSILCAHLIEQFGEINDCLYSISKQAMNKVSHHQWPGNIRELKNCLHLAINLCSHHQIEEQDICIIQRRDVVNAGHFSKSQ
ncbi:MAG: sigma 54-interacting transcriptional regulator [Methylobacter sp.]|nr:sigma 54-interacting transcriptional regulator [Methylobacter sp.]